MAREKSDQILVKFSDEDRMALKLDITVGAGRNLVVKDQSVLGAGSSDPYVKVYFFGQKVGKTAVKKKNLNPVWNASFEYTARDKGTKDVESGEIVCAVWDRDPLSTNDAMGEVRIPVAKLMGGQGLDEWLPVQPCKGCKKTQGDIHLKASIASCLGSGLSMDVCVVETSSTFVCFLTECMDCGTDDTAH